MVNNNKNKIGYISLMSALDRYIVMIFDLESLNCVSYLDDLELNHIIYVFK